MKYGVATSANTTGLQKYDKSKEFKLLNEIANIFNLKSLGILTPPTQNCNIVVLIKVFLFLL